MFKITHPLPLTLPYLSFEIPFVISDTACGAIRKKSKAIWKGRRKKKSRNKTKTISGSDNFIIVRTVISNTNVSLIILLFNLTH